MQYLVSQSIHREQRQRQQSPIFRMPSSLLNLYTIISHRLTLTQGAYILIMAIHGGARFFANEDRDMIVREILYAATVSQ